MTLRFIARRFVRRRICCTRQHRGSAVAAPMNVIAEFSVSCWRRDDVYVASTSATAWLITLIYLNDRRRRQISYEILSRSQAHNLSFVKAATHFEIEICHPTTPHDRPCHVVMSLLHVYIQEIWKCVPCFDAFHDGKRRCIDCSVDLHVCLLKNGRGDTPSPENGRKFGRRLARLKTPKKWCACSAI